VDRESRIIRTSAVGIVVNVLLSAFKAFVGVVTGSIAVTMDAVNNMTDALSSAITIIGTKLSTKKPDREHPYGYGRIEYLSAMVISVIVLYAGITALVESVGKIIDPVVPDYTVVSLVIIAVAVVVKVFLGLYFKKVGKEVGSKSLTASGVDALMDSAVSAATLVAAFVFIGLGISLEAWLGAVIAVLVVRTGIELLRDTLSDILGRRVSPEESKAIKETVCSFDGVYGAYDLVLHSYGPDVSIGSIHIEVSEDMTAGEIDGLERRIFEKVFQENHVYLTGIGIYSTNNQDAEVKAIRDDIRDIAEGHPEIIQTHGLFVDKEGGTIAVDVVVSFDCDDREAVAEKVREEIRSRRPGYHVRVQLDSDVSD
jgi:cation diffusion facilitator family transporter